MVKKIVRYIVDFVIWRFHCTSYCHNFKDWHYLDCGQSLITITFFSHKRSRAEEKYLKFAAFYFLNFTWLCHGSFRLCRTYGGMHVNWKSFFYYSRGGVWIFSGKRVKHSREALVPSTCKFLFWKRIFFPPVWPAVYTYPVKTVTENVCFQERSPKERFLTKPLCCTRVDGWKRRFMKTMTSRWWIPVNAHVLIKAGTGFNRYCVFFWTGKNHSRTQRVNADFFFWKRRKQFPFSNKHEYVRTGPW